jgi:lipoate-protein ligase A
VSAVAATLDLLGAAASDDPVLEVAVSHALLREVAAGRRGAALRIFRPAPAVAFGRLDALRPGFAQACAWAAAHGYVPVLRSVGGHAAVYDERCVLVEHVTPEDDVTAGLQERFATLAGRVRDVLAEAGLDARVGELPREYCPGAYSINVGGRLKVVGVAQRTIRGAALASAVVVVAGGPDLRAAITAVYALLELDVDPATAGALDEARPRLRAAGVAARLEGRFARDWRLVPRELDPALLAAAGPLAARHRAAWAPGGG